MAATQQNQKKSRKWVWWAVGIFVLIVVVGALSDSGDQTATSPSRNNTPIEAEKVGSPEPKVEVVPEPARIQLSGTGQQASQKFDLESGLSLFKMTHVGTSNFSIWLYDSSGQRIELLVNESGNFDGSKAVGITKKGEYILDVSASGKWTVDIEQPRPTTADGKPRTFTGVSQQVSPFFNLDKGLVTFRLKHAGKSNFSVFLMDKNGNKVDLLVNEIGDFDGSKVIGINRAGIYLLDIYADGEWTISME